MNQHVPPRATLDRLSQLIAERANASAEISYTRKLLDKGVSKIAKKVGEEGVEVAIAAVENDRDALRGELADLLYHVLVLLHAKGMTLDEIGGILESRMGRSGIDEKAARKQP